ncbi:MAG: HD domain-containing protein [Planctomycetes bacterium]|nr:HD domain-containing protein [Planctomycetota bacterium]
MDNVITETLSMTQMKCLKKFGAKINALGNDLIVIDKEGQCILESYVERDGIEAIASEKYAEEIFRESSGEVLRFGPSGSLLVRSLNDGASVVGVVFVRCNGKVSEPVIFDCPSSADSGGLDVDAEVIDCVAELVDMFAVQFAYEDRSLSQIEKVSSELAQTYEELLLLYNMSTNMKVTQSNATYLQLACDQVTQLVEVEGITIFLEKKADDDDVEVEDSLVLAAGSGLIAIDLGMADILQMHLVEELGLGKEALLDSMIDSPFKYSWPDGVRNILAVPLQGGDRMIGMMVATNIAGKSDFDSIEVKLFNSVANQCAIFAENNRLFGDLKGLFIGSLKALTNSIDAKDPYTRGHSERVAFISRWIAERLTESHSVDEEQVHKIYLAGLLHDVGKIGISESVLCKNGKLDEEERSQIMSHPRIGAGILADIKQMNEIVPGVLHHHERSDGKGYPDGLTDSQIPLIGKIVSLADAFDAMTSRRIYRDAMSIDRAIGEIEKGLGSQFNREIGEIFLNSDIKKLWSVIQDGFIERWDYSNFDEYGSKAVGVLIR